MASEKLHALCVRLLVDADVNATDNAGISFRAAVYWEDMEVVRMLLEVGADLDREDVDGDTPRVCADEGDCEGIKMLLEGIGRGMGSGSDCDDSSEGYKGR